MKVLKWHISVFTQGTYIPVCLERVLIVETMLNLVVELGYVDIIVELGDVDIMDELGYIECACLILLDKLIELILHYKNCNMLVWMFDTNMLVGNTRLFYMIGLDQLVVVPFLSFHYFIRAEDLV